MSFFASRELRALVILSLPIVVAQLGHILMNLVDTLMVGPLGADAIAGVGIGGSVFSAVMVIGLGFLTSLDTLVSQGSGAGRSERVHELLHQGLWLAILSAIPLSIIVLLVASQFHRFGIAPSSSAIAVNFMQVSTISLPFFLIGAAFSRYWQAKQKPMVVTWVIVLANVINAIGDWALINGRWGLPQMGARGVACSTLFSRIFIVILLWAYTHTQSRLQWVRPRLSVLRQLMKIGIPAGLQIGLEVGIFTLASIFSGRLGSIPGAVHQIVISIASFAFMIPLGIGSAAGVRVGFHLGGGFPSRARDSGWVAIRLSVIVMSISALVMFLFPTYLLGLFTQDPEILRVARQVILLAGLFQIFDGIQVCTTGALRGLGDTFSPLWANLIGHYGISLGLAYALTFHWGMGIQGIWAGLASGLFTVAMALTWVWHHKTQSWSGRS